MAFATLEDKEGVIEVVMFSDTFPQAFPLFGGDEPGVVFGSVQHDEKGSKILAERVLPLGEAQLQLVDSVQIHLQADALNRDGLTRLRHLLTTHPGESKTFLHLSVNGEAEAVISLPKLPVTASQTFLQEIGQHFGSDCIQTIYKNCYQ
jgi:DNA polymerase-3 subunit alpha